MNLEQIDSMLDFQKCGGLLPVIAQDAQSGAVLMQAYANKEALAATLQSGFAHYFSRSRNKLWKKGEESGHLQKVQKVLLDCDGDCLLYLVEQTGAACHTGAATCFFREISYKNNEIEILNIKEDSINLQKNLSCAEIEADSIQNATNDLFSEICARKNAEPSRSYTANLFNKGENEIGKKLCEESAELAFALKDYCAIKNTKIDSMKDLIESARFEVIYEAADLLYHALVLLAYCEISPDEIKKEIKKRSGKSGIKEKQDRAKAKKHGDSWEK